MIEIGSADELCKAAETTLRAALPMVLNLPEVKGYLGARAPEFEAIKEWHQLPTLEAISSAKFPAVVITTPGLVGPPVYQRSKQSWETTWRLAIGIYDRAGDHAATSARVRDWIAFIRTALLRNVTLGGVAKGITWAGEEYDLLPDRKHARTIGAGALAIDVRVDVPDTLGLGLPAATKTTTTLTVNP
ncbi:hypothetical protein [Nocardioides sp.]|uniref:hypothetical protein n=1 Tax=Nocardioides sp. TaxID=35761 RepID=UPI002CD71810|nr:hypothetical protein [Nocardioides sp.]HXH77314.1 hypothetical protein [Nocardioides sp.]